MKVTTDRGEVITLWPGGNLAGRRLVSVELTAEDFNVERLYEWLSLMVHPRMVPPARAAASKFRLTAPAEMQLTIYRLLELIRIFTETHGEQPETLRVTREQFDSLRTDPKIRLYPIVFRCGGGSSLMGIPFDVYDRPS